MQRMAALRSPLWWAALATAVVAALPSTPRVQWLAWVADGAQLLVAPAIVAFVLRLQTRSALLACHAVIGQLYAGIQLSPALAALASSPVGALGLTWSHGASPQRLVCLLALVIAYAWITPGLGRGPGRRSLHAPAPQPLPYA